MKDNNIIPYKENIFTKILKFIKKLFKKEEEISSNSNIVKSQEKEEFKENIIIKENQEDVRLKTLKTQYEGGIILEEDISDEDIEKLIAMYEKETEEINADTERRRLHIAQMLKELNAQ